MIDRRLVEHFDWLLLGTALCLTAASMVNLYSATYSVNSEGKLINPYVMKQGLWIILGITCMGVTLILDYHHFRSLSIPFYLIGLLLLGLVLVIGEGSHGAVRWIVIGPVRFQPSEFEKIIIVVTLATWGASEGMTLYPSFYKLIPFFLFVGFPFIFIVMEPDLGTALSLVLICGTVLFGLGLRKRWIISGFIILAVVAYPMWKFVLKEYQKERILAVIYSEKDPQRTGYHLRQSKIAIGSGGLWGKGYLRGTQNKLRFLPERHTDFAFAVWAEEFGFVGSSGILALYVLLLYRCFACVLNARDRLGALIALGATATLMWEVLINVGMILGFLPVVGMPLPFMSYGGSAMVKTWIAIGLVENVSMRRYAFCAP